MDHLWLKALHILAAMLVLGTGLGIAFLLWTAHRTRDPRRHRPWRRGAASA